MSLARDQRMRLLTVGVTRRSAIEGGQDFFSGKTRIIGLSSGLIAAAAASCLSPASPCVPVAVEAVRIVFRLGFYVSKIASRLETTTGNVADWSVLLPSLSEDEVQSVLDHFQAGVVRLKHHPLRRRSHVTDENDREFPSRVGCTSVASALKAQQSAGRLQSFR